MSARVLIEERIETATAALTTAERSSDRLSWARVLYFMAGVAFLIVARPHGGMWFAVVSFPFVALVWVHRRASARAERLRGVLAAARGSRARMDRDWAGMAPRQSVDAGHVPNRAAIGDLDVLGERSLHRLMDVSQPGVGGATVVRWLLGDPAPLADIRARQQSVEALRARPDFLLEAARLCRHGPRPAPSSSRLSAFRAWSEGGDASLSSGLVWTARAVLASLLLIAAAMTVNADLRQPLASITIALVAAQFVIALLARRHLHKQLGEAADLLPQLSGVTEVIRAIETGPEVAGRFGGIQQTLGNDGASAAFAELSRLFAWDAVHHSPMLLAALNVAVGYDAHLAARIDRWRGRHGTSVPGWIDLAGEAEALIALATLGFENPGWTIPAIHDDPTPFFTAKACGHPLIASDRRVDNPVALEAPSHVVVISGSNMSGKTTYLRALGLNALLAMAGGPVCAVDATIRRCRVRTTVRIEDNLATGVSLFFAEVSRLRDVVSDAAAEGEPPVLFLLDEILHGTNAPDRRQASQLVLQRLLSSGAAGVITTHDAKVGDVADLPAMARVAHAHFTDAVSPDGDGVRMTFDYVIRDGAATTTNALRILGALGLSPPG